MILCSDRQSRIAPAGLQQEQNNTVNAGTKNRSNCSRERCAGNTSVSPVLNSAELAADLVSSSNSSFSSRSRSSRRIWNQLTAATSDAQPHENHARHAGQRLAVAGHGIRGHAQPPAAPAG